MAYLEIYRSGELLSRERVELDGDVYIHRLDDGEISLTLGETVERGEFVYWLLASNTYEPTLTADALPETCRSSSESLKHSCGSPAA